MLRWLIAILFLANMLAFVTVRGMFGPAPLAGAREPNHLNRQIHPETLKVQPVAEAADLAVVGGPAPAPAISASELSQ
ncbi:hypothetical protein [Paraburkholderia phenazinium]|jgi:hypothetical protein|uniref:Uncharacterized protein n=1 Tax=Paraburkholderia phenazinium TaxID=60549 RepID=A0A1G7NYF1_9BURK|nr:hypothetical protein [Paraburkholderia phenazinium]SDF79062.1 hypothetical protein SAMN05216466_10187 [Paraburkholderia phenazinium]